MSGIRAFLRISHLATIFTLATLVSCLVVLIGPLRAADTDCGTVAECLAQIAKVEAAEEVVSQEIREVAVYVNQVAPEKKRELDQRIVRQANRVTDFNIRCTSPIAVSTETKRKCDSDHMDVEAERKSIATEKAAQDSKYAKELGKQKELGLKLDALITSANGLCLRVINMKRSDSAWRAKATAACARLQDLEQARCCSEVVFDGQAPKICELKLVFGVLKGAGLFGSDVVTRRRTR
jgi:hypothetical protein